ncbi:MAG: hypothetical protein ABI658_00070 [Acidimicrobiales bacterium]
MINPTISQLLGGVAASLDETVLPELAPGFPRNQLVAAISLIRRAAAADERIGIYLWEDNRDITEVLREVAPLVGLDRPPPDVDAGYPTLDDLRRRNLALQHQLIAIHDTLREDRGSARAQAALRALFERMLARESQINTSTWV